MKRRMSILVGGAFVFLLLTTAARAETASDCGGGGGLLFGKNQGKTTVTFPHVQGGLRFLVGDAASLNTGFYYERLWNDDEGYGIDDGERDEFGFLVGISVFAKGSP
ncbi:MAG: hypothetical protein ABIK65_09745 [Candidatus Eisenbacteria bacterium]